MSKKMKLAMPFFIVAALMVIAGCGQNNKSSNEAPNASIPKQPGEQNQTGSEPAANFPAPTGKVDDTVNAISQDANDEQNATNSLDSDANAAAGDANETNDLGNSYNEDNL